MKPLCLQALKTLQTWFPVNSR